MKELFACRICCLISALFPSASGFIVQGMKRSFKTTRQSQLDSWQNPQIEQTWSNRLGLTLTPITTGIWAAERPFKWNGIDVGGRMVICRMYDGTLLVHSPVELNEELRTALEVGLGGGVGHIVSPNYEHLKYAQEWKKNFPDARMYGCPGLSDRMPDTFAPTSELFRLANDGSLGSSREYLLPSVDCVWFDCEINPFTGKPFFNEVVFFHTPSRTLFCADAWWNYPEREVPNFSPNWSNEKSDSMTSEDVKTGEVHVCSKVPVSCENMKLPAVSVPLGTRIWKFGMDRIYLPFYKRFMVGPSSSPRGARFIACVDEILAWEPEVMVPCHGDVLRGKEQCRVEIRKHFLGE